MRSTKHSSLLAVAMVIGLGAGLPLVESPRSRQAVKTQPRRVRTEPLTEIEAWNEAVEARKAAKKARKAAAQAERERGE